MLMDTGGNCGSQSSTLIIRGLALNEIRFRDIFKVIFKEFRIALIVSVVLAFANGLRIFLVYHDMKLAVVIGLFPNRNRDFIQIDRLCASACC